VNPAHQDLYRTEHTSYWIP